MVYVPLPVRGEDVGAAVEGLAALGFRGANVTVPHKGAVLPYLDRVDGDAALAEAVNTIVVDGGRSAWATTPTSKGSRTPLVDACGDVAARRPGPAARGRRRGARGRPRAGALGVRLTVVNRTAAAAERLAALIGRGRPRHAPAAGCRSRSSTRDLVAAQRLLVNATSLGMDGAGKVPALWPIAVTAGQVVFDVVYARGETDFLAQARTRGATVIGGLEMLVRQAAAAFELWTGLVRATGCDARVPRSKSEKSSAKTVVSRPSDNGGAELEAIMTPVETPLAGRAAGA